MSATEQALSPLPTGDELAWIDHLAATAVGKVIEVVEYLEGAFTYDKVEGEKNIIRPRREFEPMGLEQLGSYLLLSRDLAQSADTLASSARDLARLAHSIYLSHEDTGRGAVAGVAGVESYEAYRRRIADRFAKEADEADCAIHEGDDRDPRPGPNDD